MNNVLTILVVLMSCGSLSALSLNEKISARSHPVVSFDDNYGDNGGNDNEDSLFYRADSSDMLTEELSSTRDNDDTLDSLLKEILETQNQTTDNDGRCQTYKSKINSICLSKFQERSRFRPVESVDSQSSSVPKHDRFNFDDSVVVGNEDSEQRPTSQIASVQQICCEFRLTYLRCVIPSVNMVCGISEMNTVYDQFRGLSEICSRFSGKSSRKCRRRYRPNRNHQLPQQDHQSSSQAEDTNSTTVILV